MILLAGGTSFAPIKAIVEHAIAEQCCQRPIYIIGAPRRVDLYQNALAEQWAGEHANITYVPVLSGTGRQRCLERPHPGFVHQAVLADFPDLSGYQVYACGAPVMIDVARRDFTTTRQLPEEEFFADAFTFSAS